MNGEACIAHLKSNNCLTITGAAGAEKCDSCISGYKLDNGVCYHWSHWINGSYSADNAAVANITEGTSSTAATFTCQADYWWKDTAVCKACIAGCKTCTTSILTGCTVADDVVKTHYNDTASSVLACATVGTYTGSTPAAAPLVKTCTVAAGVRTTLTCVTDDSAATKLLYTSTGAYTSAYTVSCVAIAATVDTIVSGCLEYKEDSAAA